MLTQRLQRLKIDRRQRGNPADEDARRQPGGRFVRFFQGTDKALVEIGAVPLRLPQLGPMENADMVGTDLTYNIHDYILRDLEDSHEPSPLLKQLRDEGKIGFKTGEGFQKWTPEQVAQSNAELNEYLIRMLYGK